MIIDGEPVHLDADGHPFLALHTEAADGGSGRAILVMHGRGFHPDWPEVAAPLRAELPEHGWETLSLQMPVLGKTATYYDYVPIFAAAFPRIRAGIEYLRERGADTVVLAAHSCSAHMAMAFVRHHGDAGFDGFIGIGMGATDVGQPMREPFPLAEMAVPVLDLFGDEDYPLGAGKGTRPPRGDPDGGASALRPAHDPGRRPLLPRHGRGARRRGSRSGSRRSATTSEQPRPREDIVGSQVGLAQRNPT